MLSLNKKLQEIGDKNTLEKQKLLGERDKTDKEIDELVYQLYGITEEENVENFYYQLIFAEIFEHAQKSQL